MLQITAILKIYSQDILVLNRVLILNKIQCENINIQVNSTSLALRKRAENSSRHWLLPSKNI